MVMLFHRGMFHTRKRSHLTIVVRRAHIWLGLWTHPLMLQEPYHPKGHRLIFVTYQNFRPREGIPFGESYSTVLIIEQKSKAGFLFQNYKIDRRYVIAVL